jgi:hypothetical protein
MAKVQSACEISALVGPGQPFLPRGVCLDLTNIFGALEKDEILHNVAPFTISVHLKEFAVERLGFLMGVCIPWQTDRSRDAAAQENL